MVAGAGNRYTAGRACCGSGWAVSAVGRCDGYTTGRASLSAQLILDEYRKRRNVRQRSLTRG